MIRGIVVGIVLAILVISIAFVIYRDALGPIPTQTIRSLAQFYLWNTYNIFNRTYWAASPEAVNAILWDYRGLDTVYETTVLFLALTGCLALALVTERRDRESIERKEDVVGLTPLASTCAKVVSIIIVLIAMALAFRGYITPGGGFQGGTAFAIAPLLLIAAFSARYVITRGFRLSRAAILRSLGLLSIAFLVYLPLIFNGYAMQNQPKPWTYTPLREKMLGIYTGGTLLFYNISEFLVVSMEFIAIFILISIAMPGEEK